MQSTIECSRQSNAVDNQMQSTIKCGRQSNAVDNQIRFLELLDGSCSHFASNLDISSKTGVLKLKVELVYIREGVCLDVNISIYSQNKNNLVNVLLEENAL